MFRAIVFLLAVMAMGSADAAREVFFGEFSAKTDQHKEYLVSDLTIAKNILERFLDKNKTGCFARGFDTSFTGPSSRWGKYRYDATLRIYCEGPGISDVQLGYSLTGPDSYTLAVFIKFKDVETKSFFFFELFYGENGMVSTNKLSLDDSRAKWLGTPRI